MLPSISSSKLLIIILTLSILPGGYYFYLQVHEDKDVSAYLEENKLMSLPLTMETAIKVSDQVRKDFNIDEKTFKTLRMDERPFLRNDTSYLLRHKEGLCGEGTRVIVNLLRDMGFDATRVTVYNKHLEASHTLVSVKLDDGEFFVDSINTSDAANQLLRKEYISIDSFNVLHYNSSYAERMEFDRRAKVIPDHAKPFFDHYWLYSYEAMPYGKILAKLGFDVRIFNFTRPPQFISSLAEKPNLIAAVAMVFISLTIAIAYLLLRFFGRSTGEIRVDTGF